MPWVQFSAVHPLLQKHGFKLIRQRPYPELPGAHFVIFTKPGAPQVGFPVIGSEVAASHVQRVREFLKSHGEENT